MSEIHTYSSWKTSWSPGAKSSIPTSVQGCPHSPNLNRLYVNTTPRYLGWFRPLVHLLMLIDWDKTLRREGFRFKQRKRSSSCVRHSPGEQETHLGHGRAMVGETKAYPRGTGAGDGHAPEDHVLRSTGDLMEQEKKRDSLTVLYCLGHFLQKYRKSMLRTLPRTVCVKQNKGCMPQ